LLVVVAGVTLMEILMVVAVGLEVCFQAHL